MMVVIFPYTSAQCSYLLAIQTRRNRSPSPPVPRVAEDSTGVRGGARAPPNHLTRPTLAADESLGYLPGDIDAKWNRGLTDVNYSDGARP